MLPQDFKSIQAGNPENDEQYCQPYIDQIIIKHFCCYSSEKEIYQNTLNKNSYVKDVTDLKLPF